MEEKNILKIISYLISNFNKNITINDISNIFGYDKFYIMRSFKKYTGYTIIEFLNKLRVYTSKDSLLYTDDSILKIALNNGFNSLEYYSEKFKDIIGIAPNKFRYLFKIYYYEIINDKEKLLKLKSFLQNIENEHKNMIGSIKPKSLIRKASV